MSLFIFSLIVFSLVTAGVLRGLFFDGIDAYFYSFFDGLSSGFILNTSNLMSFLFDDYSMIIIGAIIALILFTKNRFSDAFIYLSAMGISSLLVKYMKGLFMIPRPLAGSYLMDQISYSFPSGHATTAAVFFILIFYIFRKYFDSKKRRALAIIIISVGILTVGVSRMALGLHWFSDIVGGAALGIMCASGVIMAFKKAKITGSRIYKT